MSDARTPLRFFGQREGSEGAYGPFLRNGGKYRRVYDPFCGSASVTAFAMRNGLADEYVFSDVDRPLMDFWALVKALPELVIARYQELAEALAALPSDTERAAAFDAEVARFNDSDDPTARALLYPFLLNASRLNLPRFRDGRFVNVYGQLPAPGEFAERVRATHRALNQHRANGCCAGALDATACATDRDLVLLDPPYPDCQNPGMEGVNQIYNYPGDKRALHQTLLEVIDRLNARRVPFLLFYGAMDFDPSFLLDERRSQVHHWAHLGGGGDDVLGFYSEHIYTSTHPAFEPSQLPARVKRFDPRIHGSNARIVEDLLRSAGP
ncbi:MAG TPA: DNA adenine methylase [Polyangiaceae bacterium]|nr:DNA adenine methylase [Polyangiaceae bacterium]